MWPALVLAVVAQALPPPFPREGAELVLENERVAVWDVRWAQGRTTPKHRHRYTALSVTLTPGRVRSLLADGSSRTGTLEPVGAVQYGGKGLVHREEGVSETPRRVILVELKESPVAPLSMPAGVPAAWPREGALKVLDTDLVVVWDYTFAPGREVPLHFHDKDAVVVEISPGTTRSDPLEGEPVETRRVGNRALFAPRGRLHAERHVEGSPRVIVVELK